MRGTFCDKPETVKQFHDQLTFKMEGLHMLKGFKDTHGEEAPSNKTPALTKSTNMGIWVVGTSNQFFIRGS